MNTILWISQCFLAVVFTYSGWMKSTKSEDHLVAIGQTGVEHLPIRLIRFIGLAELAGVIGLLVPGLISIQVLLTPIAAFGLGLIMIPAAGIHYRRHELKAVWFTIGIFLLCLFVAWKRL
ncbi:DoxX family protein [Spirosoma endbachense]|uniref:DoxX family membrane protein n=1 Tax=Spirosoma endbachense TaxID=2666025 RepID=A0A6P1VQK7_9BACT|nr:DoxX family protein [Spirosoma endbachense]QHV93987.1 DoxX family membrane protein [Spirosoma endbachense]